MGGLFSDWLKYTSEIKPGQSAVLGENYFTFYTIHYTAASFIVASLISCIVVITSIALKFWKERRWDFSDRFPLYLAVADFLWGISHLTDHLVLLISETYQNTAVARFLSIYLWFFLGYQTTMHAGLATYIYLKVVRRKSLNLGAGEWKLHAICVTLVTSSILLFAALGSFGCTGYWYLQDVQTVQGHVMGVYVATSASLQAFCTTVGYRSIVKEIRKQNEAVQVHYNKNGMLQSNDINKEKIQRPERHSTATKCLNTFVRISVTFYCTFAIAYWSLVIQTLFGILEPFTVLINVIVANSSGWANALGYFYNRRVKSNHKASASESIPTVSNVSTRSGE